MAKLDKKRLTKNDVKHIAELSNLKLSSLEMTRLLDQLSKIIEFVGALSEVNTNGIEPTSQTTGLKNVLREDVIKTEDILSQDKALSGTDNVHNNLFKVPAILSERSLEWLLR